MILKRFKNGNINVKFEKKERELDNSCAFETFFNGIWEVDLYVIGEEYCLSNYTMGITLYSAYSDTIFIFPYSDIDLLLEGKTIKLIALIPDKEDRELIEKEFNN